MIQFNSQNTFKEIHYDGHDIKYAYGGCSGDLVWEKEPQPFGGKFKLTLNDSSTVSADCSSSNVVTSGEVSTPYSATVVSVEIGNCAIGIGYMAFAWCYNLKSITISDSVTSIDNHAFYYCSGLRSVTIPSGVISIGERVFANCANIQSITIEAITPPTLGGAAFNNTNDCPIYVPAASVNAYKTATNWSDYADRIQAIP